MRKNVLADAAGDAALNTHASHAALHSRRRLLKFAGTSLALLVSSAGFASAPHLVAVRVWPGTEYTRITLESSAPIEFEHMMLTGPDRLVVDLKGVELNTVLQSLSDKVRSSDPLIEGIRAGRNRPGVVRVVVDLKDAIKPQLFTLQPIADYGHRLVLDLYPSEPYDPLLALIGKSSPTEAAAAGADQPMAPGEGGTHQVAQANRVFTVVIDAGHGGEDPGAIGTRGSYEKNITLAIARRLQQLIDDKPGMQAVMTRKGDYFVPLYQRVAIARRAQADLFVSIHADAFVRPEANGSSVYVLSESGATSSAARWLAQRENEADLIGGVNLAKQEGHLARTLLDLSQTATINDSLKLASAVLSELDGVNRLHKPNVEQAGFAVLRSPDVPSILVETAFISNPDEERRLNEAGYQNKMAEAILRGIGQYFANNPPLRETTVARAN